MPKKLEGGLVVDDASIAIVVSRFNDLFTSKLLDAAVDTFVRHGGDAEKLTIAHVPGSFELPLVCRKLAESGEYDAVVALGCVIRGATGHYDHVAAEAAKGIGQASASTGVPVIFGVITADSIEQAVERSGSKQGNQGAKAMLSAIEMVNLMKRI